MEVQNELKNFIKVWTTILISISFCYAIGKKVPFGLKRLILTIPVVSLFLFLPLKLTTINLGVTTSFLITWLCSFKLLLFSLGKGPLIVPHITSLYRFVVVSCLPIEIRQNPPQKRPDKHKWALKLLIKFSTLAGLYYVYNKKQLCSHLNLIAPLLQWPMIYLSVETIMAGLAGVAQAILRADLETQFDEPYKSTSMEDFWFQRYNLPVSHIMCTTIQDPIFSLWTKFIGPRWALVSAVMVSFLINGLIHELIYYYVGRVSPTWEVTRFFILHGLVLIIEIYLKKALFGVGTWRIPRAVSIILVNGFMMLTTAWLFFPPLLRLGFEARLLEEFRYLGVFFKTIFQNLFT